MNTHGYTLIAAAGLIAGLVSSGCGREAPRTADGGAKAETTAALPADLFADQAPAGERGVRELKADKDAQGEVVIFGRIGGRARPYADGAAVFLLADAGMKTCTELHEEDCPTPWDYCCEPRDSLAANTATIQIVGADGKPLRIGLADNDKLPPTAKVTIAGEVALHDEGALVVNARKIYVHKGED